MRGIGNSESGEWEGVAALAGRQHGVAGRQQLRELGVTDRMIDRGVATARLFPLFHGSFAVGHPQVGDRGRMLAAVLACGKESVVSHGTAAALLGLWDRPPTLVNVIAQAAVLRLLDVPAIDAILESGPRRRGSPRLRAILDDWRVHGNLPRLRSRLEAKVVARLAARDLPLPLVNHKMKVGGRRIEADLIWPEQRLVVEADGRQTHDTAAAFERDRRRDRDLAAAGYRVLRITWSQLEDELERTLNTIARLVEGRS
jgi:very-short-patch-repair endonuclease